MTFTRRTSLIVGLLISISAAVAGWYVFSDTTLLSHSHQHEHATDEWHTHADFKVYIQGTALDFSKPTYMTTPLQEPHRFAHLHDENGQVLHLHAPNITFAEFLSSLGYSLTEECFTTATGDSHCTDETNTLVLYVNNQPLDRSAHATYQPADLDRILLIYGNYSSDEIDDLLAAVSDESCIYSGSCPERGIAPAESCGLTCEL
jgi:hypothetical protein